MRPLIDHAHQEKEAASDDTMVEHLHRRAVGGHRSRIGQVTLAPGRCRCRQTQHKVPHVAHRGVGNKPLEVPLGHTHQGTVDDAEHGQDRDNGYIPAKVLELRGKDGQGDAHHAKAAQLEQHACQDDAAGRGRCRVRVGQPGMEREQGHLDGKGDKERPEGQRGCPLVAVE